MFLINVFDSHDLFNSFFLFPDGTDCGGHESSCIMRAGKTRPPRVSSFSSKTFSNNHEDSLPFLKFSDTQFCDTRISRKKSVNVIMHPTLTSSSIRGKWFNVLIVVVCYIFCISRCIGQTTGFAFSKSVYNASIQENCLPRTFVRGDDLMGVPLDNLPPSTQVQYSIVSGDRDGFFAVEDEEVGGVSILHIRTKTGLRDVLNRERRAVYTLKILAEARSHYQAASTMTAYTVVRINIEDTNDNIPLFYPDSYNINPPEDLRINSPLVTVKALDADSGINGEVYYYLSDPTTNLFSVHPKTGVVSLTRPFHSSHSSKYYVKVLARDRGKRSVQLGEEAIAQADVAVSVFRVNNESPRITVRHLPHVVEHAHAHIYAILTVTDSDEGLSGTIGTVEVVGGDPDRVFSIARGSNENEYNLIVLRLLDRELAPLGYNLTVYASDKGKPPRSSELHLFVSIEDINDHSPVFLQEEYEESVSEEAPPNTPVVRVAASDTDEGKNADVTFKILAGNSDNTFKIHSQTGLISTSKWLDAETMGYYSLTVVAMDQASSAVQKQSSAKVTIRILDSNDNAPDFGTVDEEVFIDENEPAGSYVTRVIANDIDSSENGFLSYSLANRNQMPFTVHPFDGVIRTTKILDYESGKRTYYLRVRASDWGQPLKRESETSIRVVVNDVNDNRPQFLGNDCAGWLASTTPVGSPIVTLKAVDLDADSKVTYRLIDQEEHSCWSMNKNSGILSLNCDLRTYVLRSARSKTIVINATASDGRYISDPSSITLTVVDSQYNENPNLFNGNQVKCKNTNVALEHMNAEISAHQNNAVSIPYDDVLSSSAYGYNAHSPNFLPNTISWFDVLENIGPGSEIFTINANDEDYGYDGKLVYSISAGDVDSVFEINSMTGVVSIAAPLDREKTPLYILNITAYDLGTMHRSTSTNVTIKVLDVNDNAPQFARISYHLHLPENTKNGTSVAQILAVDADEGDNARVSYELITNVKEFSLDPISGILSITQVLDREKVNEYDLRIRAWDHGETEQRYSITRVLVTVLDINDRAPDFGAAKQVVISAPEDYPVSTVLATMHATDQDLGSGGVVSHRLINTNDGTFRIDSETGIVRIASELDYERDHMYNLTIRAEDSGLPSLYSDAYLIVYIQDVDETQSQVRFLQRLGRGFIKENEPPGTLVMTLSLMNPDSRPMQFDIVGGNGHGFFSVNRKGKLK